MDIRLQYPPVTLKKCSDCRFYRGGEKSGLCAHAAQEQVKDGRVSYPGVEADSIYKDCKLPKVGEFIASFAAKEGIKVSSATDEK